MYQKVKYDERLCEHCNKVFTPNRKDKKYCKETCQKSASSLRTGKLKSPRKNNLKWAARQKKDFCECCGFKATHRCQLDLDHIDGDHKNNDISNLQTLCANCHRLKTWMNKDWENKKDVPSI